MTRCSSLRLCTSMDWDKDGDTLAVSQDKNGLLLILIKHLAQTISNFKGVRSRRDGSCIMHMYARKIRIVTNKIVLGLISWKPICMPVTTKCLAIKLSLDLVVAWEIFLGHERQPTYMLYHLQRPNIHTSKSVCRREVLVVE